MYRERDYNRNQKTKNRAEEEFWNEASQNQKRSKGPKVTKGESVFDTSRSQSMADENEWEEGFYGEKPHRYRSAREDTPSQRYDEDELYVEDSLFRFGRKKQKSGKKCAVEKKRERKERHRRKKHPFLKVFAVLVVLFLAFWFYMTSGLNSHPLPKDDASLGITSNGKFGVTNIALFGVDARDDSDTGRSDAMMVVTVDMIRGDLKMTSLLRDSKVPIEGHGETKLNHAYAYGGPELAVKTINQNFDLDIKEFVTVNFNQLADIVDAVGGVTIDVTEAEREQINHNMEEIASDHATVEATGAVLLDGTQAVAYSRIRSIDSDNARTDRQQEVLNAVFTSVKTMNPLRFPKFVHDFSEVADTSISSLDVLKLVPILLRNPELETYTIPDIAFETDLWGGIDSSGMWCWHYDLEAAAARMRSIAFGE